MSTGVACGFAPYIATASRNTRDLAEARSLGWSVRSSGHRTRRFRGKTRSTTMASGLALADGLLLRRAGRPFRRSEAWAQVPAPKCDATVVQSEDCDCVTSLLRLARRWVLTSRCPPDVGGSGVDVCPLERRTAPRFTRRRGSGFSANSGMLSRVPAGPAPADCCLPHCDSRTPV